MSAKCRHITNRMLYMSAKLASNFKIKHLQLNIQIIKRAYNILDTFGAYVGIYFCCSTAAMPE